MPHCSKTKKGERKLVGFDLGHGGITQKSPQNLRSKTSHRRRKLSLTGESTLTGDMGAQEPFPRERKRKNALSETRRWSSKDSRRGGATKLPMSVAGTKQRRKKTLSQEGELFEEKGLHDRNSCQGKTERVKRTRGKGLQDSRKERGGGGKSCAR